MPAGARQIVLAPALLMVSACAAGKQQVLVFRDERVGACTDGTPCELAGALTLHSEPGVATTASIGQVQSGCIPLLIPSEIGANPKRWEGKQVRVFGTALARARGPIEVTRVRYRDRWLLEGICGNSDIVVYVDRVQRER